MKAIARFLFCLVFLYSITLSRAQSEQQGVEPKKGTAPAAQTSVNAKAPPAATKASDKKKPADTMGKIDGIAVSRGNGTWLGLNAGGGVFCLSFYDAKKKPVSANASRATARWQSPKFKSPFNDVFNLSSDGKALFGSKPVTPPRNFKVYLTLLDEQGQVLESHVVDYHD